MPKQQQSGSRIKLEKRYGSIGIPAVQSAARYSGKPKTVDARSKDTPEHSKRTNNPRRQSRGH